MGKNLILIIIIFALSVLLILPIIYHIPSHPDEHQFYLNAFSIMGGKPLHNYVHIALTEYLLAGFLTAVAFVVDSGVNFPNGDPSFVTFFYGRIFGLLLYVTTFILGCLLLQKEKKEIRIRTVVFSVLYFGSLGVFERFFRVNSDSMSIFVYFNFLILSFYFHKQKASVFKFFILNAVFLFLTTFTNLKAIFLMLPVFFFNTVLPFNVYDNLDNTSTKLPKTYRFILYAAGLVLSCVLLWVIFMPRPYDPLRFWYTLKKTVVHGTAYDFDYPSQSFQSWKVYIYDFFVEYLGLTSLISLLVLYFVAKKHSTVGVFKKLWEKSKTTFNFAELKAGNLFKSTEVVILMSFIVYYLGVSTRVVHWSRWGVPLGVLGIMLISVVAEDLIKAIISSREKIKFSLPLFFVGLFAFSWILRTLLTVDLVRSDYPAKDGFIQTYKVIDNFLTNRGFTPAEFPKKAAWFTGYTSNINSISLDHLTDTANKDLKYIMWPYWNIGPLYTKNNVDLGTHNQRALVDKYAQNISYGFPSFLSYYMHYTKLFAWNVLGITWNPEIDSLVETQFGIVTLKEPVKNIKLSYDVGFKDMSHYHYPYSLTYNLKSLPDSYIFPPCYTYPDTIKMKNGEFVAPPREIGVGARTAGLYCHSVRFRILFKGTLKIRVEGLPQDTNGKFKIYSNLNNYEWDLNTKTITYRNSSTKIPGEFGVAITQKYVPNLNFHIFYTSEQ